jgi:alpha-beta hydrolase superfamily lysophospholipase
MEVTVLNPNHPGSRLLSKKHQLQHGMVVAHTLHVFDDYIANNQNPKKIFIIAHSMGGECTSSTISQVPD